MACYRLDALTRTVQTGGEVMENVSGIKAVHAIITDECRSNRGNVEAGKAAVGRVATELDALYSCHAIGKGVKFHVVLTVEIPQEVE